MRKLTGLNEQFSDTNFALTPSVVGIHTVVTDRVKLRIAKEAWQQMGRLAQNAIQRKKDVDGLTVLDGATNTYPGAGSTLTTSVISSSRYRISSNTTEPGLPPYRCVLHGFQLNLRAAA